MIKLPVYNLEGRETGNISLDEKIFGAELNPALLHQAVTALMNNARTYTAHTKTRSERRGGGRKPWKQKGTGRARAGTIRSPIWKKGGVTFGPRKDRNYDQKINKKMRRKAMTMALSGKVKDKELVVVENWQLKEAKTKELAGKIGKLKIDGTVLAVTNEKNDTLTRAGSNLKQFKIQLVKDLNILDVLNNRRVVIEKEAVKSLTDRLSGKIKQVKKTDEK